MRIEDIKKKLRQTLDPERYEHSLSTAQTARQYAKLMKTDENRAFVAGLVHDCAKYLSPEKLLSEANRYNLVVDEIQKKSPHLLHAPLSAVYAQKFYEINDEGILTAVAFHTTGRADMSLLEKVVFTADLLEPLREYDDVDDIRKIAEKDFDMAVLLTLEAVIRSILRKKQLIHPDTIFAYNSMIGQFAE